MSNQDLKIGDFKIGNYAFQVTALVKYYIMRIKGKYNYPKPALIVPLDGWISNEKEILQAMLDDPAFEVKLPRKDTK